MNNTAQQLIIYSLLVSFLCLLVNNLFLFFITDAIKVASRNSAYFEGAHVTITRVNHSIPSDEDDSDTASSNPSIVVVENPSGYFEDDYYDITGIRLSLSSSSGDFRNSLGDAKSKDDLPSDHGAEKSCQNDSLGCSSLQNDQTTGSHHYEVFNISEDITADEVVPYLESLVGSVDIVTHQGSSESSFVVAFGDKPGKMLHSKLDERFTKGIDADGGG